MPEAAGDELVERRFAGMAERRVAGVVAQPDRLGKILVQAERARDHPGDPGRLERVRHARPVVVVRRVDEDLRLALQAAERLRVQDPVAVALERRPHRALGLGPLAAAGLVGANGERRKRLFLELTDPRGEGFGNVPGEVGHQSASVAFGPAALR